MFLNERKAYLGVFVGSYALVVAAIFIEYHFFLNPCPLCDLQRIAYIGCGTFSLFLFLTKYFNIRNFKLNLSLLAISYLFAFIGLILAGWQVYLQYYPQVSVPSCGASLARMFETYPFLEVLKKVMYSSGECADIDFKVLGFSLAVWSVVIFCAIMVSLSLASKDLFKGRAR